MLREEVGVPWGGGRGERLGPILEGKIIKMGQMLTPEGGGTEGKK